MKSPLSTRSRIYRIAIDALFVALYVVLGTVLSFKIPGAIQISLSTLPLLLVAFLFSPADAAAVALLGTFLEQVLDPSPYGFATLPIWLIPGVAMALTAAFGAIYIRRVNKKGLAVLLTCATVVCAEILLTVLNTGALYLDGYLLNYPVKALHLLLPTRALNCLVRCLISSVLVNLLLPPLRAALKRMR